MPASYYPQVMPTNAKSGHTMDSVSMPLHHAQSGYKVTVHFSTYPSFMHAHKET
jgi:hypothetical protein